MALHPSIVSAHRERAHQAQEFLTAQLHAEEMARRPASLIEILARMRRERLFTPAPIVLCAGTHWLQIKARDGRICDSIPITAEEAALFPRCE
jgi:hypothetical protein